MGWVRTLPSGKYQARYRDKSGRVRSAPGGPFTYKADAARAANAAEEKSRSLGWRAPDAAARPWGEWCEEWWPTRPVEASTLRTDARTRDNHLMPRWGDVPLIDITRHDVRAWAATLRTYETTVKGQRVTKTRASATVSRIVHLLSASLAAAVDAEILDANVAVKLKLGGGSPAPERYITREEFAAISEHLDGEYARMAALLVGTGLRWGEAAGLHWGRIDPQRGVVEIAEVWSLDARTMIPYPKGKKSRHVPLPSWVALGDPTSVPSCGYDHRSGRCRGGLVITTENGTILDHSKFTRAFHAAVKEAGLPHVRVHDLRHTYASWLLQAGRSLAEVGKLLGHVSPLTTQRYAHLAETQDSEILAALGSDPRIKPAKTEPASAEVARGHLRLVQ